VAVIDVLVVAFIIAMVVQARAKFVTAPSGLRVREKPGTDAKILEVLPFRAQVFGEIEENWMRLEDRDGYVDATWLSIEDPCDGWTFLGSWMTTAYTHTGNVTASGAYPTDGYTVATNSLPMGTKLWIAGIGTRVVQDRGPSSMPDAWLDIFMDSYSSCVNWGARNVDVWLVPEETKTP
jgi:3D (Asp-Asp-Asp) domain-containing protein